MDKFLSVNYRGKCDMLTPVLHLGYFEQEWGSKGKWRKVQRWALCVLFRTEWVVEKVVVHSCLTSI